MTDKVLPSFGRTARSREFSAVFAYAGGSGEGIVWPSSSRLVEDSEGDLATGALGAYNHVSTSGLDVTFDTGEAIVRGAYCARDEQTTYTLPSSSTTTIYLGWKDSAADTVIIGESGDFGDHDPKLAIWTFDTDSDSVTGETDERPMADEGYISAGSIKRGANIVDENGYLAVSQGDGSGLNADVVRSMTPNELIPDSTNTNDADSYGWVRHNHTYDNNNALGPDTTRTVKVGQAADSFEVMVNESDALKYRLYEAGSNSAFLSVSETGTWNFDARPVSHYEIENNSSGSLEGDSQIHLLNTLPHDHTIPKPE